MNYSKSIITALLYAFIHLSFVFAGETSDYEPYISVNKNLDPEWVSSLKDKGTQRVYKGNELNLISMPCGGIGAGQIEVTGTGELGTWWIFNVSPESNRGRGYTSGAGYMEPLPIDKEVENGFVIGIKKGNSKKRVFRLDGTGFDDIHFIGEYPIASFQYQNKDEMLPVKISSKVYSPFVPLNVRDSANPVTVLSYTVENTSDNPVEIDLGAWLENVTKTRHKAQRLNQTFKSRNLSGVNMGLVFNETFHPERKEEMVLFEDFESHSFSPIWHVEGDAFTNEPMKVFNAKFSSQINNLGGIALACSRHYKWDSAQASGKLTSKEFTIQHESIRFKIAGGNFENETCINLVIDEDIVHTATGNNSYDLREVNWNVSEYIGKTAQIVIVDSKENGGPYDHILVDDIYFVNPGVQSPAIPKGNGEVSYGDLSICVLDPRANVSASLISKTEFLKAFENSEFHEVKERVFDLDQRGIGAVSSSFILEAAEKKTVTFLVSWYFPNLYNEDAGGCVGHIYNNWYKNSVDVAHWITAEIERLERETELFRSTYHDTTLPYWLANRITMPLSTLACDNVKIHENGRMYCFEGVSFCNGTCGHVYNFVAAIAKLFPELERSVRLQQDFNESYGFDPLTGRINFRGKSGSDPLAYCNYASDAQSGYVLKAYREHLNSANNEFLESVWSKVKFAMNYQVFRDGAERSLEPNGILEDKQTFWDPMWWGPNPYNNTLYLAALRAAEEMARIMGEGDLANRYRDIFESGSKWMQEHMWNGEYYVNLYPEGKWSTSWNGVVQVHEEQNNAATYVRTFGDRKEHYYKATACDAQQLFGQNWAHQLDLGYILPKEHCRIASDCIFKYNWTSDIADVYEVYPPHNRTLAAYGEAAMVNGSWPKVERQHFENTHDKDDIWTGLEYESACDMITEGHLDEGLVVIRSVHDRYEANKRNPWNEIEGADHYSRAMHAWNILLSLSGFSYNGPLGKIGFNPRITPENFKSFFSVAEGWGSFEQQRDNSSQTNKIEITYGELNLNVLKLNVLGDIKKCEVSFMDKTIEVDWQQDGYEIQIVMGDQFKLREGENLSVSLLH